MSKISKPDKGLEGTIMLPASKSISNRLLILQFLHPDRISVSHLSAADDTVLLETLLHRVRQYLDDENKRILTLDVANSGTVMRFLIALLSGLPGSFVLRGDPRISERPVRALVNAMIELGADIQFLENQGSLPLFIKGKSLTSKETRVDASESSQHVSALLLVSSIFSQGIVIVLEGQVISRPYIEMTCRIMGICGFSPIWQGELIRVFPEKKRNVSLVVEPDWSSAAFWYGMMALAEEGKIFFPGLKLNSLQGDEEAFKLFSHLGVKSEETPEGIIISKSVIESGPFEWNFRDCPDLAVPAILTCAFLGKKSTFRGLEGLRVKESDRISALQEHLRMFNGDLIEDYSGIWQLKPIKTKKKKARVKSFADHRIAMAMALAVMAGIEVELDDPYVVSKSYPGFWRDLRKAGFEIR